MPNQRSCVAVTPLAPPAYQLEEILRVSHDI